MVLVQEIQQRYFKQMTQEIPKQPIQAYIFFGEDDFSLKRKIDAWKREFAKKYSSDAVVQLERAENNESQMIQQLEQSLSPSLFASKKLIIAKDFFPKATETRLGEFLMNKLPTLPQDHFLVLWLTSRPDRRVGMVKKLLSGGVVVTEFDLPHGRVLNGWIKAYAKTLDLTLDEAAIDELAKYLGRDFYEEKKVAGKIIERKEAFNLWQAHSELEKLASYTKHVDLAAVRALIKPKVPDNVFALSDELVRKNYKSALTIVENLLSQPAADEKTMTIKIIGLLAEQVRGMLVVKALQEEGKDSAEVADALGWSSGRVFVTSKNAATQKIESLKKMLQMLTEIDMRLKSTDDNPKLLIGQFVLAACR
jgi:DNA polymerase-3 subunit delta